MNILYVIMLWFSSLFGQGPGPAGTAVAEVNRDVVHQRPNYQILGGKRINPRTVVALEDTPLKPSQSK